MFGSCFAALLRCFMFGVRPICGSVVAFCTWFTSGIRFYCGVLCSITPAVCLLTNRTACGMLRFYSAGSRSPFACSRDVGAVIGRGGNAELVCAAMRFCCGVLCLVYARYAVPLRRFVFDHACCLSFDKQDGLRNVAFLFRRVEIAIRAFSGCWRGYLPLWVHFGFGRFFMAISTGLPGTRGMRGTGLRGAGGAAFMLFCATTLALLCFPRGVRWGCAPQTAPKSLRLSGLSSGAGRAAECALRGGVVLVQILIPAKSASAPISAPTRAKPGYMERPDRL